MPSAHPDPMERLRRVLKRFPVGARVSWSWGHNGKPRVREGFIDAYEWGGPAAGSYLGTSATRGPTLTATVRTAKGQRFHVHPGDLRRMPA